MPHREFKDRLYAQFARIGAALSSDKRLELIDLLAQAPRHVEALATETEMSVANTSQHLQALKAAHLVETARDGTRVVYRLAGDEVLALWLSVRGTAERHLADVSRLDRDYAVTGVPAERVSRAELRTLLENDGLVLLDVRPQLEYASGHISGAVGVPIGELESRLSELPTDKRVIVYCRGAYCRFADDAVARLRRQGIDAVRLDGGWEEWAAEHRRRTRATPARRAGRHSPAA